MIQSCNLVPPACGSPKDDCHPSFATCTNTSPGQFECKCIAGYSGNGRTCIGMYEDCYK